MQAVPNAATAAAKAMEDSHAHARLEEEIVNGVKVEGLIYRLARIVIMQQYLALNLRFTFSEASRVSLEVNSLCLCRLTFSFMFGFLELQI